MTQKQLEDKGFVVASETDYSDSVPQGYVISTNPTAGTEWAEGNTVTMVVSMGKEKISVPDVSGADPDSAQTTLQGVGLTLGSEAPVSIVMSMRKAPLSGQCRQPVNRWKKERLSIMS